MAPATAPNLLVIAAALLAVMLMVIGLVWMALALNRGLPLRISGQYGNRQRDAYTIVEISVAYPVDVYVKATRRESLGIRYRASGDAELDRDYRFLSRPDELLAMTVASAALRVKLLQTRVDWLCVTPYEVSCLVGGVERDEQRLHRMVELVGVAADAVAQHVRTGIAHQRALEPDFYRHLEAIRPPVRLS